MRKSIVLVLAALASTADGKPKVAICSSDMNSVRTSLVAALNATGAFETIAVNTPVDCYYYTPSLAKLKEYDAVLSWGYYPWSSLESAANTGSNLAAYVDGPSNSGGDHGVVELFGNFDYTLSPLQGAWATNKYSCINPGGGEQTYPKKSINLASADTSSALTENINSLECGYTAKGGLSTGSTSALNYSDGTPAIAYCGTAGHRRVALNVYPNGTWVSGDYVKAITNALLYVSGWSMPLKGTVTSVGSVVVNSVSEPITVTYVNQGGQTLQITGVTLTGAQKDDYSILTSTALPVWIPPGSSVQFQLQFKPTAVGARTTHLKLTVEGKNTAAEVVLTGQGVTSALAIQPMPIHLGGCKAGSSKTKDILITNKGQGAITLGSVAVSGAAFAIAGQPALPASLQSGDSVTLTLRLSPTQNGLTTGTLTLSEISGDATPKIIYPIDGYGGDPQIALSLQSVGMGAVDVGASASQTVTLSNGGDGDLVISLMELQGDGFSMSPALLTGVEAHSSVPIKIVFAPTKAGMHSGTITLASNAGPKMITLSGKGLLGVLQAAPAMVNFAKVRMGKESVAQTVTLSNGGDGSLVVKSILMGAGFSKVSGPQLPQVLKPNEKVTLGVACSPTMLGPATGIAEIETSVGKAQVALACEGIGPSLVVSPKTADFALVPIGTTSDSVSVTLLNNGTDDLKVNSIKILGLDQGDFVAFEMPPMPFPIQPGETQLFKVTFNPSKHEAEGAKIVIDSDDLTSPAVEIPLWGKGAQLGASVNPALVDVGLVGVGLSGMKSMTISNTGDLPLALVPTLAGPGGPRFTIDRAGVIMVDAGQSTLVGVIFTPSAQQVELATLTLMSSKALPVVVSLKGTGTPPPLQLNRDLIDFQLVPVHSASQPEVVKVTNLGGEPLAIEEIRSSDPQFKIDASATAKILGKQETTQFAVTFSPLGQRPAMGQIRVLIKGSPLMATVSVKGEGAAPAGCSIAPTSSGNSGIWGVLLLLGVCLRSRVRS